MPIRKMLLMVGMMICPAVFGMPQQKRIKYVRVTPTSPISGKEMYNVYCAVCHGAGSKGNGPAAEVLKTPPSDLTTLARKNGGKYPSDHVRSAIEGNLYISAHGSKEMPVWGDLFWRMSQGHSSEVQLRVNNLNRYIESLQVE